MNAHTTKHASTKNVSVHACMAILDVVKVQIATIKIIVPFVVVHLVLKVIHLHHVFVVCANTMKIVQTMKHVIVLIVFASLYASKIHVERMLNVQDVAINQFAIAYLDTLEMRMLNVLQEIYQNQNVQQTANVQLSLHVLMKNVKIHVHEMFVHLIKHVSYWIHIH